MSVHYRIDGLCFSHMSFPHRHTHTLIRGQSVRVVSVFVWLRGVVMYVLLYLFSFAYLFICIYVIEGRKVD